MHKDGKRQPEDFSDKTRATGGRPYKIHVIFNTFASAAATANVLLWSETPFVCLTYFRRRENTFTFGLSTATRFAPPLFAQAIVQLVYLTKARGEAEAPCALAVAPAKVALAICLTYVPKAREKGWRNRVHTNVGALCAVERANAVKAPSSLKVKATDTAFHLTLKSQYRLPIIFISGAWSPPLSLVSA